MLEPSQPRLHDRFARGKQRFEWGLDKANQPIRLRGEECIPSTVTPRVQDATDCRFNRQKTCNTRVPRSSRDAGDVAYRTPVHPVIFFLVYTLISCLVENSGPEEGIGDYRGRFQPGGHVTICVDQAEDSDRMVTLEEET